MENKWSGKPEIPEGYVLEVKPKVLFQVHTRNFYPTLEVCSSLEKAIMKGNVKEAWYWTVEYATIAKQFMSSTWSLLFQLSINSIGVAEPALLITQWKKFKAAKLLDTIDEKLDTIDEKLDTIDEKLDTMDEKQEEEKLEEEINRGSVENRCSVDIRCVEVLLETVRMLCQCPKSRLVDSVVHTFFMPYPASTQRRPYEPHRDRAHLTNKVGTYLEEKGSEDLIASATLQMRQQSADSTIIRATTYIDEYDDSEECVYSLYQLEDTDPPYIAPWCNALMHMMNQVCSSGWTEVLERGILYYAGLIYQCNEPTPRQRKLDSVYLLWDIVNRFVTEDTKEFVYVIHTVSDDVSKHDNRRERGFIAFAFLVVIRRKHLVCKDIVDGDAIEVKQICGRNSEERLEISEDALDYTTKEGKTRKATVSDYIQLMHVLANDGAVTKDPYFELALHLEVEREKLAMKDSKKVIKPVVPYLCFAPEQNASTTKKKAKSVEDYNVSTFNVLPIEWLKQKEEFKQKEEANNMELPWRGQFVPYEVVSSDKKGTFTSAHPFLQTFTDIKVIEGHKGLFAANFSHPAFATQQVFFVSSLSSRVPYFQCLVDELKPLFGIPYLGTHCLYTDAHITVVKKTKKEDNTKKEIEDDKQSNKEKQSNNVKQPYNVGLDQGSHVFMFPIRALGFTNLADIPSSFSTATVDVLSKIGPKKAKPLLCSTDFTQVRNQVTNIYLFYLCVGVSNMPLSNMFLVNPAMKGCLDISADKGIPEDELNVIMNSVVVPFCETPMFSNATFPSVFKKVRNTLMRNLLVDEANSAYFMCRFFDIIMNLDYNSLEIILDRFHAPTVEWSGAIRNNVRDARVGWCLWTQQSEAAHLVQREKNAEKNRIRNEKKRAQKILLQQKDDDDDDEEEEITNNKKRVRTPKASKSMDKKGQAKKLKLPPLSNFKASLSSRK